MNKKLSTTSVPSSLTLVPGQVDLAQLRHIHDYASLQVVIEEAVLAQLSHSANTVQRIIDNNQVVYGINTGFGKLASTRIELERLAELQRNLVLSHSVGTGEPLADSVVRLVLATKAVSLSRGYSGVRRELVEALLALLNAGVLPRIPAKGSVGASGDLAPLAHLACVLIGEGQAKLPSGEVVSGKQALAHIGLTPFVLQAKEGLALLNGTQVSTSLALSALFMAERVFAAGVVAGALSLEAIQGSVKPFDPRIQEVRGQPGQIAVAAALRSVLEGSGIVVSHAECGRVQDPYSIRCMPQVMGACLDNLTHAAKVIRIEANAASDNPLVFENGDVISGGNFHAEPVAFAADIMALAVAEVGAMSERRLALLLDSSLSGLPPFLMRDSGVNSGFMIAQVTAAALASENKSLAHPASVDSLPTSANQEDHVSMATFAARRLQEMINNTAVVVGIEAMAAAQGIDLKRGQARSSDTIEQVFADLRRNVAFMDKDRFLADDIESMRGWAHQPVWPEVIMAILPSYQTQ